MRYDRRVDTKGLRKVRREAEREREREGGRGDWERGLSLG